MCLHMYDGGVNIKYRANYIMLCARRNVVREYRATGRGRKEAGGRNLFIPFSVGLYCVTGTRGDLIKAIKIRLLSRKVRISLRREIAPTLRCDQTPRSSFIRHDILVRARSRAVTGPASAQLPPILRLLCHLPLFGAAQSAGLQVFPESARQELKAISARCVSLCGGQATS